MSPAPGRPKAGETPLGGVARSAGVPSITAAATGYRDAHKGEFEANKLSKRLHRLVGQAIADFGMIAPGDKVMVCMSGGKDSYALLDLLLSLRERAPVEFDLVAVNLDQKQPGFPAHVLPDYLNSRGVPFHIEEQDTYSIVRRVIEPGKTTCGMCSRLRRGILYRVAGELGATKIALGHHRDDIVETFFLNLFFGGQLKGMPPKLVSDDGRNVVIRPLAYVAEADLARWARIREFPLIPCSLCGSQENAQRRQIKALLRQWERDHPGRVDNVFGALSRVTPSHLMDRTLFDFAGLKATGQAFAGGDTAFDPEPCETSAETGSAEQVVRLPHGLAATNFGVHNASKQEHPQGRAAPSPPPVGVEKTWGGPAFSREAGEDRLDRDRKE